MLRKTRKVSPKHFALSMLGFLALQYHTNCQQGKQRKDGHPLDCLMYARKVYYPRIKDEVRPTFTYWLADKEGGNSSFT